MTLMVRKFGLALLALALGFGLVASIHAADEKKPTEKKPTEKKDDKKEKEEFASTHDIMESVPGKKGLVAQLNNAAKDEKWDDAKKIGEKLKKFGGDLGKNAPDKGTKESWAKLSEKFDKQMTAMAKGAEDKDGKAIAAATKEFGGSCKACHDAHQKK
jgi:cytochrome c556